MRLRARREHGQHGACEKGVLEYKVGDRLTKQETRPGCSEKHWGAVNVSRERATIRAMLWKDNSVGVGIWSGWEEKAKETSDTQMPLLG